MWCGRRHGTNGSRAQKMERRSAKKWQEEEKRHLIIILEAYRLSTGEALTRQIFILKAQMI